jgi:hypothetical protein
MSPTKIIMSRGADESQKSTRKAGSIRHKYEEESSGIRGLFKSSRLDEIVRGPVSRVSDLLWKKESSPGLSTHSGASTDESDIEDARNTQARAGKTKTSRGNSKALEYEYVGDASPQKERKSYLSDMRRGRSTQARSDEAVSPESDHGGQQQTQEERRRSSHVRLLEPPPRIDIQNPSPASSPDLPPAGRSGQDSDVSDLESRRGSYANGVLSADARLNAVLGLPGRHRNGLPVTGLSKLEANHDDQPSLKGKRQWNISDRGVSVHRGPMTKREIARVRALLLSSGIKAKEICRRAAELRDIRDPDQSSYSDIVALSKDPISPVPRTQEHILAARILSNDIQLSSRMWQASADNFCSTTVNDLLNRIEGLQGRIVDQLTPMTRKATDEADEVSKDLVTGQTLAVKRLLDMMDKMMRRRRRRFRWLRRGGWVMLEWALVGVMWYVWFLVVLARIVMGVGRGVVGVVRWLFWM